MADVWGITRSGAQLHRLHNAYSFVWRNRILIGNACCGVALIEDAAEIAFGDAQPDRCSRCATCSRHDELTNG